jgi:hypothetical protein
VKFQHYVADPSNRTVCDPSPAGIVGSNPAGGIGVFYECRELLGIGLCYGLITRPEESYRLWCVWLWLRSLHNEATLAHGGLLRRVGGGGGGKYKLRSSSFSIFPNYSLKLSLFRFEKGRYCYFPKHHQYLLLTMLWRTVSSAMWPLAIWGTLTSVAEQHTASLFQDTTLFFYH